MSTTYYFLVLIQESNQRKSRLRTHVPPAKGCFRYGRKTRCGLVKKVSISATQTFPPCRSNSPSRVPSQTSKANFSMLMCWFLMCCLNGESSCISFSNCHIFKFSNWPLSLPKGKFSNQSSAHQHTSTLAHERNGLGRV